MKLIVKYYGLISIFTLVSCGEATLSEYKFAERDPVLNCDDFDNKLLNEALFSFEDDIRTFYRTKYNPEGKLGLVYSEFLSRSIQGTVPFQDLVTPHTLEVFNVLKTKQELWDTENKVSKLNYYSPFFGCIASNIKDNGLRTTLNALISTHSMSPKLFNDPLIGKYPIVEIDKYLGAYVAFDLFYAKLFDIDPTKVKERELINYY